MAHRNKHSSKSGISRIFSLSLNQAITSKGSLAEPGKSGRQSLSPQAGEDKGGDAREAKDVNFACQNRSGDAEDAKENLPSSNRQGRCGPPVGSEHPGKHSNSAPSRAPPVVPEKLCGSMKLTSKSAFADSGKKTPTASQETPQGGSSTARVSTQKDEGTRDRRRRKSGRPRKKSDSTATESSKSAKEPRVSESEGGGAASESKSPGSQPSVKSHPPHKARSHLPPRFNNCSSASPPQGSSNPPAGARKAGTCRSPSASAKAGPNGLSGGSSTGKASLTSGSCVSSCKLYPPSASVNQTSRGSLHPSSGYHEQEPGVYSDPPLSSCSASRVDSEPPSSSSENIVHSPSMAGPASGSRSGRVRPAVGARSHPSSKAASNALSKEDGTCSSATDVRGSSHRPSSHPASTSHKLNSHPASHAQSPSVHQADRSSSVGEKMTVPIKGTPNVGGDEDWNSDLLVVFSANSSSDIWVQPDVRNSVCKTDACNHNGPEDTPGWISSVVVESKGGHSFDSRDGTAEEKMLRGKEDPSVVNVQPVYRSRRLWIPNRVQGKSHTMSVSRDKKIAMEGDASYSLACDPAMFAEHDTRKGEPAVHIPSFMDQQDDASKDQTANNKKQGPSKNSVHGGSDQETIGCHTSASGLEELGGCPQVSLGCKPGFPSPAPTAAGSVSACLSSSGSVACRMQVTASLPVVLPSKSSETKEENWELELMQLTPNLMSVAGDNTDSSATPIYFDHQLSQEWACQQMLAPAGCCFSISANSREVLVQGTGPSEQEMQELYSAMSEVFIDDRSSGGLRSGPDSENGNGLEREVKTEGSAQEHLHPSAVLGSGFGQAGGAVPETGSLSFGYGVPLPDSVPLLEQNLGFGLSLETPDMLAQPSAVNYTSAYPSQIPRESYGWNEARVKKDAAEVSLNAGGCKNGQESIPPGFVLQRPRTFSGLTPTGSPPQPLAWPDLTWGTRCPEDSGIQNKENSQAASLNENQPRCPFNSLRQIDRPKQAESISESGLEAPQPPELCDGELQDKYRARNLSFAESDVSCGSRASDNSEYRIATLSQSDTESCLQLRQLPDQSGQEIAQAQGTPPELETQQQFSFQGHMPADAYLPAYPPEVLAAHLQSACTPETNLPVPPCIPTPYGPWYPQPWFPYPMPCYGYSFQGQESLRTTRGDESSPVDGDAAGHSFPTTNWQQEQNRWPVCPSPVWQPPSSAAFPDGRCAVWDHSVLHIPASAVQTETAAQRLLEFVQRRCQEALGLSDVSFEVIVRMKTNSSAGEQDGAKPSETNAANEGAGEQKKSPKCLFPQPFVYPMFDMNCLPYRQGTIPAVSFMRGGFLGRTPVPACFPRSSDSLSGEKKEQEANESGYWAPCGQTDAWMFKPPPPPPPPPSAPACWGYLPSLCSRMRGPRPAYSPSRDSRHAVDQTHRSGENHFGDAPSPGPTTSPSSLLNYNPVFPRGPSPPSRQNHQQRRVRDWRGGDVASNTADTSSGSCRLDVSLNGQRDYDASSSDLDEEEQGRDTNLAFCRSPYPSQGTQFQRVALDGISRDSGSDDVDSSSVEYAASNRNSLSSAQEQPPNVQNDDDDSKATGDSPKNDKYVIPARRSRPAGLSEFMSRRVIPRQNKSVLRRSFPADAETEMGMNVQYKFGRASACRMFKPEGPPVCAPGAYPKLPEQDYWQSPVAASSSALNDEEYPALATGGAVSQSGSSVLQGSYARAAAKNCASGRTSQTFSSDSLKQSFEDLTQFRGEENCKTFFRGARRLSEPGFLPSTGGGVSAYASRLLSDNRVMGWTKWGVEAYDAFFTDYKTTFIDTHCHLDFLFNREQYSGSYADYREKNRDTYPSNYEGCVAVFCNPKTFTSDARWRPLVEEPGVWMAMGCHPKSATDYNEWADHGLRQCLRHPKTVALGEIGLDYSKTYHMTAARQKEVFIRQLKMALELKLPLVIHCREAEDDCLQIMEEIVPRNYKIHCHCFTGNYESCLRWTSSFPNLFIGLTPLVTYHSATDTHEVAQRLPLERLLFETDAPYFLPCHFSSNKTMSMSHPGLALMVAVKVAELRNVSVEEVLQQVRTNTFKMYGL